MIRVKESKSLAKEPNFKVSYLAFPFGLDNEGHHTMPLK